MSDNDALIIVPSQNVSTNTFLKKEVKNWLRNNLEAVGGRWTWHTHKDIDNESYVSFSFYNISNSVRLEFANTFGGKLVFNKSNLFKKLDNRTYIVYVPELRVSNGRAIINKEVIDWFNEMKLIPRPAWFFGLVQDDIDYVSFLFEDVDEEIITLFKIMFG